MGTPTRMLMINGININMLGIREPDRYGFIGISSIIADISELYMPAGIEIGYFQTNSEHMIADYIHQTYNHIDVLIINPAGHTHTSISIRDSILSAAMGFTEMHLSNITAREVFRHRSYFSDVATTILFGYGVKSYYLAIKILYRTFS